VCERERETEFLLTLLRVCHVCCDVHMSLLMIVCLFLCLYVSLDVYMSHLMYINSGSLCCELAELWACSYVCVNVVVCLYVSANDTLAPVCV